MDLFAIGAALKEARKGKKLSQEAVASATDVGRSTLSRLENGTIEEIGIRKVIRICEYLGVCLEVEPEGRPPTLGELLKERQAARSPNKRSL